MFCDTKIKTVAVRKFVSCRYAVDSLTLASTGSKMKIESSACQAPAQVYNFITIILTIQCRNNDENFNGKKTDEVMVDFIGLAMKEADLPADGKLTEIIVVSCFVFILPDD